MSENGLECLVNEPTRITEHSKTCIDHVFVRVDNRSLVEVNATVIDADITDHCLLQVDVRVLCDGRGSGETVSPPPLPAPQWRTDYALLNQLIDGADWSLVYVQLDASSAFDAFFDIFQNLISQSRVKCIAKNVKTKKLKPWMNDYLCIKIKRRNHIYKLTQTHPENKNLKSYYRRFKNKLQNDIKNVKDNYYKQKFEMCKGDSRATWEILNKLTGQYNNSDKQITLEINNTSSQDPLKIANEFNNFFLDIINQLDMNCTVPDNFTSLHYKEYFETKSEVHSMYIEPVLPAELLSIINSLKSNTSPGMDGFSSALLKIVASKIINVLSYLINYSFESGVFPKKLKHAVVIPIYKSGPESKCNNYRPISLLSCFSKVYEKIMKKKLIGFLQSTDFFGRRQFGFRTGMNTENALINFMTDVYNGINTNKCVSGLFLDIKKAFDTVDHKILLDKLHKCGVRGIVHKWFGSYLIGRQQCVRIKSVYSDMGEINSGVPQGSVLGAILFIIYVNDLCCAKLKGKLTAFADDTALCYIEESWDEIEIAMTKDLEALQWWFSSNHMLLSAEKTKFINFNLKKDINLVNQLNYKCAGCLIEQQNTCKTNKCAVVERTSLIKYLGMYVDSEVSWKVHIKRLKDKINNTLRCFYFLRSMTNQQVMRTLYFALVQSRIEYGIVIWGNAFSTHINPIFLLQKHFIRMIAYKNRFEHSRPLFNDFKIFPLKHLFVFKVLKLFYQRSGNIPQNENPYRQRLRNLNQHLVPKPNNTFFTRTFNFVAPRIFNKLPHDIKVLNSKNMFLNKLKKWLLQVDNIEELLTIQQ
uniref:Reverse transcriptase domain-containing protein n=1 Tax=Graphocephala atropunctata TaxID=36148 RepID=A0A1B6MQT2_9HEMI